jgi:hypothetical protein
MGVLLIRSLSNTDSNRKKTLEEAVKLGGFILASKLGDFTRSSIQTILQDL